MKVKSESEVAQPGPTWPPSQVRLFATPWTVAYQAPLSMGVPRQEDWSGVPLPSLRGSLVTCIMRLENPAD